MRATREFKDLFRSPLTEYLYFLFNWYGNKFKFSHKNLYQSYMSIIRHSEIGQNVKIYPYARVFKSQINSYTYIGISTTVYRANIGKFCSIGQNCSIGIGNHPSHFVSTSPIFYSLGSKLPITFVDRDYYFEDEEFPPINIGNDVWIGNNVTIKGNIKIGDGAIIGNGAVVTKDVPCYCIYGGVPAKLIRLRFSTEIISFLLKFQWWEKDESWLKKNHEMFHDIENFHRILSS